jgi:hypothetical protein
MDGQENAILNLIHEEVKEMRKAVSTTQQTLAENKADVKNLVGWAEGMNAKMENLEKHGGAHGQVLETRLNNLEDDVVESKKDIKAAKSTKKQSAALASAFGAIAAGIVQGIAQAFK